MSRPSWSRIAALAVVPVVLAASPRAGAQAAGTLGVVAEVRPLYREVSSARVAEQLGVKLAPGQAEELAVGTAITGSLTDPARIATFGIAGAPVGARVTIMRAGPDRVRVEVDELDPVPRTRRLALKVDGEGRLSTQ